MPRADRRFDAVRAASLAAAFSISACAPAAIEAPVPVPTPPCDAAAHDDLRLAPRPPSRDQRRTTTGTVVDALGEPVRAARLRFWNPRDVQECQSRSTGWFALFAGTEGAHYDVDVIVPSDGPEPLRLHAGTVTAGDERVVLRVAATQQVVASGILVDPTGRPLADCSVLAERTPSNGTPLTESMARTAAGGGFRLLAFSPAGLGLVALDRGCRRAVTRRAGETDVFEAAAVIVEGRVILSDGSDAAGTSVQIRAMDEVTFDTTVAVGARGEFRFPLPSAGTRFEVIACDERGLWAGRFGWCASNSVVDIRLVGPLCAIDGRVLAADGAPLRSAWLRFTPNNGEPVIQALTDERGAFRTVEARDVEFGVHLLVPGADGRLVPGPFLGRLRGGARSVELRVPR